MPVSLKVSHILIALQKVATARLGNEEVQATTEGNKALRINIAMAIEVDGHVPGFARVVGDTE